jgi:succinate-semialdehyde dehydrogenase/glutarate-semialdehyde dehydrogenase
VLSDHQFKNLKIVSIIKSKAQGESLNLMNIETFNPATEELMEQYLCLDELSRNKAIKCASERFLTWKRTSFETRAGMMRKLATLLEQRKEELALMAARQMGKPVTAGQAEVQKCAWVCHHYAEHAQAYLAPEVIQTSMKSAKVHHLPLGPVFAIMPWNFPFWQVFRCAAPTIMAGNTLLLKHAPITTGIGNEIETLFLQAGFPQGVFQHLILDNEGAAAVIACDEVVAVTLTGSEQAGRSVAACAGKHLKKSVLELGGSDPYLVLADADLDLAAQSIVSSRLNNCGQVCIAAKRILVESAVAAELTQKILKLLEAYTMGNPEDPKVTLGPLARKDLRDNLDKQVRNSIKQGAKLLLGGIIPGTKGYYYPPTVLSDVRPGMPAFDEELFGPVLAIIPVSNEHQAIEYANKVTFGLGAAVFSRSLKRAEEIATFEIEAGVCFVNSLVASDPRLPFGGIKRSGYGRELGREGILEFVNTKTIAWFASRHAQSQGCKCVFSLRWLSALLSTTRNSPQRRTGRQWPTR